MDDADVCNAVSKSKTPIVIIHGTKDKFVPYYMAEEICRSCKSDVELLTVVGAGHAMSFYQDNELYIKTMDEFLKRTLKNHGIFCLFLEV